MDTDLFQGVLLALLAIGLVVLIALLATLGGIRKALERRVASEQTPAPATASEPETTSSETGAAAEPAAAAEPVVADTASTPASGAPKQADTIRSVLEQHGLSDSPTTTTATPAAAAAATPAAAEPVVDSAFASHADDPQEEPFQRDGRWWFRRGDELLLYNEGTGQWEPALDQPAAAASPPTTAAQPSAATQSTATTTAEVPVAADQVSSFWKCPTCGAVNGTTATSCRMCFAPRP
ncbi:MAG TPA: Ran-binding zinc finger domain-containing protein [Actinomycetota bacterium]|nr:Ran-binding zinc finger domain-containing protein [Actinomycetota bacterium]